MTYGYGISILCLWREVGSTGVIDQNMMVILSGTIIAAAMITFFVSFIDSSMILRFCFSQVAHAVVF